ncbi:hypothetical protein NT6N_40530 [Oceaniferula spumae]|uniref:Uncharacterized protein n=1 Tax=Oceaniferula spumae TaxID=2979115 RepID=A0AAT9FSL6_9BACT
MEDGKELDKKKSTKAIVDKGLQLNSYEKTDVTIPDSAYNLKVSGTG